MNWLSDLQEEMSEAVITGRPSKKEWQGQAGFKLYQGGYQASLQSTLSTIYPVVRALVGVGCFKKLCQLFIASHALHSWDLDRYGAEFRVVLRAQTLIELPDFIVEMAELEWACHDIQNATSEPRLVVNQLLEEPSLLFQKQPSLVFHALLMFQHNVLALWRAHQQDLTLASGFSLRNKSEYYFLCLVDNQLNFTPLENDTFWFVQQLKTETLQQVMDACEQNGVNFEQQLGLVLHQHWFTQFSDKTSKS